MTDEQKNEEAHGLWELAVSRLAAAAEIAVLKDGDSQQLASFVADEREAYVRWKEISWKVTR